MYNLSKGGNHPRPNLFQPNKEGESDLKVMLKVQLGH
jgi:hypothetical protein